MPEPDAIEPHDNEHTSELRSYVGLVFAALLVAGAVWLVNTLREDNRIVECVSTGHHNCVPLDTSVKGAPR